ncbi:MAG TPA: hypothetical protein PK926_05925 [Spirochaetota bacterium]|nr:hypothetical protein [Spirochaetota bacterium]HPI87698.1 hypothetical protein [Spirochaetota bacterium]HPR48177.1 hypothetical protein [Spirochaetota bacterium]
MPSIRDESPERRERILARCRETSISRSCRFVHSIEADLQGNRKGFVIGISVADPASRTLESAIMSLEGIVLFQARYARTVSVSRAIDLFSSPSFAQSMMKDIALIFFAPENPPTAIGSSAEGSTCRFATGEETLDIIWHPDGSWKKILYRNGKRVRSISALSINERGFPAEIELEARGDYRYTLYLKLISAEYTTAGASAGKKPLSNNSRMLYSIHAG